MDSAALASLVQASLPDLSNNAELTSSLVALLQASTSTSAATVALYSCMTALVLPILQAPNPRVAEYLIQVLLPALHPTQEEVSYTDEEKARYIELKEQLADVLIDVVWQLEQEIDSGVLHPPQQAPEVAADTAEDQKMDVDADAAPVKTAEDLEAERVSAERTRKAAELAQRDATDKASRERLGEFVKTLVTAGILSATVCLDRLETMFLSLPTLQLVSDARVFSRLEVRARTALYYKQQKFNLLREESEGYSKLAIEMLANVGPPHSSDTGNSIESVKIRMQRAISVGDKVKSLIGNFDLDPDRTLDIILDTFSDQIVHHYQFFLDFLSVSPWAPRSKMLAARAALASADESDEPTSNGLSDKGKRKELEFDPGLEGDEGKRLIAQILGFKFAYYQMEGVEEIPETLYLLAAMLIEHGFVKLGDLWTHLSPGDDVVAKIDTLYRDEQEKLARSVGGANALAMAGALVDDEAPAKATPASASAAAKAAAAASAAKTPCALPNQKLGLLKALLTLGDVTHSLFILAQFPYLVPANLDIADLLNRLLSVAIQPAYNEIALTRSHTDFQAEFQATKPKYVAPDKQRTTTPSRIVTQLTHKPFPDPNKKLLFFFPAWSSCMPKAGDWEEVLTVLEKLFLPLIGVFISRDFSLYTKICRIIVRDLSDTPDNPRLARWLDLIRQFLLPAISLLSDHTAAALELWKVLALLPIEKRFQLYGEWKDTLYRRIPALAVRKAEAERDVKSILRRLSTENVKKLGKTLAKSAHTNPAITFSVALNQVQSYDNLIVPVVEAARYLTDFGYDVLTYSLLDALASGKSKTKEDGTSVALWLQGLATFAGQLYRRWAPMAPSLWIVIQYLVNQLASGDSKDLVILRELITRMTGIEPFADLSDAQVLSLAGGKVLRSEVFFQTDLAQASKKVQNATLANAKDRLTATFKRSGLAVPLLVNIALQRKACTATDAHLKSLGALYDQNHAVLFQYMEFLSAVYDSDELAGLVPPVTDLLQKYHLDSAIAFDIARPKLRLAMRPHDEKEIIRVQEQKRKLGLAAKLAKEREATQQSQETVGEGAVNESKPAVPKVDSEEASVLPDVAMEDVKPEQAATQESVLLAVANGDVQQVAAPDDLTMMPSPVPAAASSKASSSPWHPGLLDVIETIEASEILPSEVKAFMGTPFFVTFWQLTLFDIVYPKQRYDAELSRLTALQRDAGTSATLKADDKERFTKSVLDLAKRLMEEASQHAVSKNTTSRRLARESKHWFDTSRTRGVKRIRDKIMRQIVQHCIVPRAKLSLPDAVYCYTFVKRLHALNTPVFGTVLFFDKILNAAIAPILFSCSENEARNFARFLFEVLSDVEAWYKSKDKYQEEVLGAQLHGFCARYPADPTEAPKDEDTIPASKFTKLARKWEERLTEGFCAALDSGEYMHIKNSILVLTKIAPVFPIEWTPGVKLEHTVSALIAKETREDLKILAQGYKAVISKRKKHWAEQPKVPAKASPPESSASAATKAISDVSSATSRRPTSAAQSTTNSPAPGSPAPVTAAAATAHTLPVRPGQSLASNQASASSTRASLSERLRGTADKSDATSAAPNLRRTDSSSSNSANPAPVTRAHPSLPARPGAVSGTTINGSAAEKLRQEALSSRDARKVNSPPDTQARSSPATITPMDPPPAPTVTTAAARSTANGASSVSSAAAAPRNTDSRPPSRASSRPTSPRGSDSGRRERGRDSRTSDVDRDRDAGRERERERSTRKRSRDRSVESAHSSSRSSRREHDKDKDASRSSASGRDRESSRRDDRDRGERDGRERSDRESRRSERDSRGDRDKRGEERSKRDEERSSSRRDSDGRSSRRREDERRSDERRRSERESARSTRGDDRASATVKAPTEPRSQREGLAISSAAGDRRQPTPTGPRDRPPSSTTNVAPRDSDILSRTSERPASAAADASPAAAGTSAPTRSELSLSIKGGSGGAGRVFNAAVVGGGGGGGGGGGSGSGSGSERDRRGGESSRDRVGSRGAPVPGDDRSREVDPSRDRPARGDPTPRVGDARRDEAGDRGSKRNLMDRLGRDSDSNPSKRPRTDDRPPPPGGRAPSGPRGDRGWRGR